MALGIAGLLVLIGVGLLVGHYKRGYKALEFAGNCSMVAAFIVLFLHVIKII